MFGSFFLPNCTDVRKSWQLRVWFSQECNLFFLFRIFLKREWGLLLFPSPPEKNFNFVFLFTIIHKVQVPIYCFKKQNTHTLWYSILFYLGFFLGVHFFLLAIIWKYDGRTGHIFIGVVAGFPSRYTPLSGQLQAGFGQPLTDRTKTVLSMLTWFSVNKSSK